MPGERMLVIGSGGREHALGWKLSQSTPEIFFAPGNGGTEQIGTNIDIDSNDIDRLTQFVADNDIGLTVVGPEEPLTRGIVDAFQEEKMPAFGPVEGAARLEGDKAWAASFMERHGIPHPESYVFTDPEEALDFVSSRAGNDIIIKYPYLAAGKGVIVPDDREEASRAVREMLVEGRFGKTDKIVIQERIRGPEVSVLAFSDGNIAVPLLPAQDHKRIFDGDKGPNTGGMGTYAPVPMITPEMMQFVQDTILQPTIDGMREEGLSYKGMLFAGLMLTDEGPSVLEFNARFGDPETQPLMLLLQSELAPILQACIQGSLRADHVRMRDGAATCVVLAADGYPGSYQKGAEIHGLDSIADPDIQVFQAGTLIRNGQPVTSGGRVLGVTAYDRGGLQAAITKAYSVIDSGAVGFRGMQYRHDIGAHAITKKHTV